MWSRILYNPSPYDDDFEDQPGQGPAYQWGLGAGLPLIVLGYGVRAAMIHQATFGRPPIMLHGINAVALGVAAIALAGFLHCHYFWGNIYNQAWFAVLGKIISAMAFIAGLGVMLVRVGVLGLK